MKSIYKYFIFLFVIFLFPMMYSKAECSNKELNLFLKYQEDFKITSVFNSNNEMYTVTFHNPLPDTFGYQIIGYVDFDCNESDPQKKECSYFPVGSYLINIIGRTDSCNDIMSSFEKRLAYNEYYLDPVCEDIPEFVLCSPSYDKKISYEEFINRVNLYKSEKTDVIEFEGTEEENQEKDNVFLKAYDKIKTFIMDNLILVLTILTSIIMIVIIIIASVKRYKSRWKLE